MNAYNVCKIGDIVFFNYGCMIGEDFGTVVGFDRTPWGDRAWVRMSNFCLTTVETLNGTVGGTLRLALTDGCDYFAARGFEGRKGIGAYLVTAYTEAD